MMKKFNQMAEKQMAQVHGGMGVGILVFCAITGVLVVGGALGMTLGAQAIKKKS